jgi:two-component system chemotaxis sensor kinase CheA
MGWRVKVLRIEADRGDVDDLTKEFLAESLEGLDRMDRCLTDLEDRPTDKELLGEIFRSVHTIKGTTGFLGFGRLEKLAHAGETLLGSMREGRLVATREVVGGLLQLMDGLRAILALIELKGTEGTRESDEDGELIRLMEHLNRPGPEAGCEGEAVPRTTAIGLAVGQRGATPETPAASGCGPKLTGTSASSVDAVTGPEVGLASRAAASPVASEKTLRIDVEILNRMMNLVGELVLTRNQILQSDRQQPDRADRTNFSALARRLDSVTAELRETVMQARMQPVGHIFGKFPRMVRDVSLNCGKTVRLEFSGQETGLDKGLLEAIKDPLTHAVRNAIDHGIEEPRARLLVGKPAEGVVRLRAYHHNGSVVIEVEDDGAGISTARVLAKAIERGLVSEERAAEMTQREALQLVFEPGFSTAAKLTNVSGRGVGMDVVLANVQNAGGTVELESREGVGTTLRLRLPLTLAIVQALVVRSGGHSFCLPQGSLAELVYVPRREAAAKVEWIGEAELYRLRERLLPMVRLDRMLGLKSQGDEPEQAHGFYLVVLELEGCAYGLVVDDLMAPEEIVVKPLSPVLREIGLFSGATVLGSGSMAMILDVAAVGLRARVKPAVEVKAQPEVKALHGPASASFLIFEDWRRDGMGGGRVERVALPLSVVVRIESIAVKDVEYAGERPVLQYRGELLALEDGGGVLREVEATDPHGTVTVLICQRPGRGGDRRNHVVGMVVRRVVEVAGGDVLDHNAEISAGRIAKVHERVTVVHDGFGQQALREVA